MKLKKNVLSHKVRIWHYLRTYTMYELWRCPWCNGYRRRKWTWRYQFKSWTRLIAFNIALIPLGKYESNYSPSSYG